MRCKEFDHKHHWFMFLRTMLHELCSLNSHRKLTHRGFLWRQDSTHLSGGEGDVGLEEVGLDGPVRPQLRPLRLHSLHFSRIVRTTILRCGSEKVRKVDVSQNLERSMENKFRFGSR